MHFEDGTSDDFDVIVYATGYNITFPFFDPDFLSAPDNHLPLYKRMFKPGIDDLAFVGLRPGDADAVPVRGVAGPAARRRTLVGAYALPDVAEMERVIVEDEAKYIGHVLKTPRHTQQVDYFIYEHDMRAREIPAGRNRAGPRRRRR